MQRIRSDTIDVVSKTDRPIPADQPRDPTSQRLGLGATNRFRHRGSSGRSFRDTASIPLRSRGTSSVSGQPNTPTRRSSKGSLVVRASSPRRPYYFGLLGQYPQRDSNPCRHLERVVSWATRRWGPGWEPRPPRASQATPTLAEAPICPVRRGGLEPPISGPEPLVLPITPSPIGAPRGASSEESHPEEQPHSSPHP